MVATCYLKTKDNINNNTNIYGHIVKDFPALQILFHI